MNRSGILGFCSILGVMALSACGGGGGSSGASPAAPAPVTFAIAGSVSNLGGTGLVLRNNGGDDLELSANGTFTFATRIQAGAAYAVTVHVQPSGPTQECIVSNGSGTVASANISNISVTCTTRSFRVAGMVSGLVGTGLQLRNADGTLLPIASNGTFQFPAVVLSGSVYSVLIDTQPDNPRQVCTLGDNAGITGGTDTSISVTCNSGIARFVYVPDFTLNNIVGLQVDATTGLMNAVPGSPFMATKPERPVITPSGKFYYLINSGTGSIAGFAVNASSGALALVPGAPFNVTGAANNLISSFIEPSGRFIYAIPTGSPAQIYALSINPTTGSLAMVPGSPFAVISGLAWIGGDPLGRYVYGANASGQLISYRIDSATGALASNGTPAVGSGGGVNLPTATLHPKGSFIFSIYTNTDTLNSFRLDDLTGQPQFVESKFAGPAPRFARVDPLGRFVYVTAGNNLRGFSISSLTGVITEVPGSPYTVGIQVGDFDIDPTGRYLYAPTVLGNTVQGFRIDASSGALTAVPASPYTVGTNPSMVRIDASGTSLFVASFGSNTVQKYSISSTDGALTLRDSKAAGTNAGTLTLFGTQ